uniref:Formamidopyrimidine-DNA glycosylase n=1 Tax=Candidatus Kentrum sp. FM TaxID=2126340 RepID=A0A450VQZ6_9GAMM|nr:MAG: formamidopyrimidine-DNA glycosylase [Candidatus Kentron sp. FM]VFJ58165.1 MAG: formamidopyrimidine-DNA glycosylase [Candidatus Kentron sp. FM]VFK07196.1 MAG: formamidopyrimidine-DNA glycosylase [Candidatus Kentron sp. FM]
MPELPEVETTRRGLTPHLVGNRIEAVVVRNPQLRWPVADEITRDLPGQTVREIARRGKYLLFRTDGGTIIVHLGMSGNLRVIPTTVAPGKHDHVDFVLKENVCLRFRDPRRFGAILWTNADPLTHPRLANLGPEPLGNGPGARSAGDEFSGDWLFKTARNRRAPVKCFLLDGKVVAGLGNIYVNEALFRAGILPSRPAGSISRQRYDTLATTIQETLREAIDSGGTTLRDFLQSDGKPGYFRQRLLVYGRAGEPCPRCGRDIGQQRICQRSSFFCSRCQE